MTSHDAGRLVDAIFVLGLPIWFALVWIAVSLHRIAERKP